MANSAQARKRARQAEKHRRHNAGLRSRMRTHVKKVQRAVDAGDKDAAEAAFKSAVPVLDATVGKKLAHKNTVARRKSRLNARLKAMS